MNSNTTNKSSKELQSDVRSELNQIKHSLDNIKNRISPGQLIDDAIFYPHRGDPAMTFDHLKRNPIGTSFLAIGTLLLMEDNNHISYETTVKRRVGEAAATSRDQVEIAVAGAREKVNELKGSARATVNAAKTKVGDVKARLKGNTIGSENNDPTLSTDTQDHLLRSQDQSLATDSTDTFVSGASYSSDSQSDSSFTGDIKEKITDTMDSASTSASQMASQVKDTVSSSLDEAARRTESLTDSVRSKVSDTLNSASDSVGNSVGAVKEKVRNLDPMAYIAIGAGLGALSGATLPVSEAEHRMVEDKLGGKLDAFKADLQSAFHESYDVMKSDFISGITDFDFSKIKDTFSSNSQSRSV